MLPSFFSLHVIASVKAFDISSRAWWRISTHAWSTSCSFSQDVLGWSEMTVSSEEMEGILMTTPTPSASTTLGLSLPLLWGENGDDWVHVKISVCTVRERLKKKSTLGLVMWANSDYGPWVKSLEDVWAVRENVQGKDGCYFKGEK